MPFSSVTSVLMPCGRALFTVFLCNFFGGNISDQFSFIRKVRWVVAASGIPGIQAGGEK